MQFTPDKGVGVINNRSCAASQYHAYRGGQPGLWLLLSCVIAANLAISPWSNNHVHACPLSPQSQQQRGGCCSRCTDPDPLAALIQAAQLAGAACNTGNPVAFSSGAIVLEATDVGFGGAGSGLAHDRSYSNVTDDGADFEGPNGYNWFSVAKWPHAQGQLEGTIEVIFPAGFSFEFQWDGTQYQAVEHTHTLSHSSTEGEFVFKIDSVDGTYTYKIHDFDQTLSEQGRFKSYLTPSGDMISALSYSNSGQPEELQEVVIRGTQVITHSLVYTHYSQGESANLIESVSSRRDVDGAGYVALERAVYTYYGSQDDGGPLRNLSTVTRQHYASSTWHDQAVTLYRYYKSGAANGFEHGMKFVVEPESYRRLSSDSNVTDPLTATDQQVSQYADMYFEYEDDDQNEFYRAVTKEVAKSGCSSCGGGGHAGDTLVYELNANYPVNPSSDQKLHNWKVKTTVTHADGNLTIAYTNGHGGAMLVVGEDGTTQDRWYKFQRFGTGCRVELEAQSSAITGFDEAYNDLLHEQDGNYQYLSDSAGLIKLQEFHLATDAPTGAVVGYPSRRQFQQGETGTPILLESKLYLQHEDEVAGTTTQLWKEIQHPDASDANVQIVTQYAYTFHSGTLQMASRTTTLPVVSSSQNGSGTADTTQEVFDENDQLLWRRDERGVIQRREYDPVLGQVSRQIDDVDTAQVTDEPGGWSTVSGFGLHLVTDYSYDDHGRLVQALGPAHTAVDAGQAKTVRRATWMVYTENGPLADDVTWTGQGYALGPSFDSCVLINPVTLTYADKAGRTVTTIEAKRSSGSGALSAGDTFAQADWQSWTRQVYSNGHDLTAEHVYHDIPSSGDGTAGTHYAVTQYGYDTLGRRTRVVSPVGTITRVVYDARGQAVSLWVGTDDEPTSGSWSPSNQGGADLVLVQTRTYDGGQAGGDGNLTAQTNQVDASTTRVTVFGYDWRNRLTTTDGEVDQYQIYTYDNLGRMVKTDRYDTDAQGYLLGRVETSFDDRGRVYQTRRYAVDPSDGSVGVALTRDLWYDPAGNVVKTRAGAVLSKTQYDGLGRIVCEYTGYDLDETTYADALTVDGDTVTTQVERAYDAASNLVLATRRERLHDATGTGELTTISGSQPQARVTYFANWYDGAAQQLAQADYGTNADQALTRPDVAPAASDTVLVTTLAYDDAGRIDRQIDPQGIETRSLFDDAGRLLSTIENYTDGDPTTGNADEDRQTDYTYNLEGQIATLTARMPSSADDQTTTYVYGVTTAAGSELNSHSLLRAIIYPDSDDPADLSGTGSDGAYDRVELTYNRLHQVIERKDQRETVHVMEYDALGRLLHDRITSLGRSGEAVDGAVRRISHSYEVRGMLASVTSYDNAAVGAGAALNEVAYTYNDLGQLLEEAQAHDGAVDSSAPTVALSYEDGSDTVKQARLARMTYPNGRQLHYLYADPGDSTGVSHVLGRVTALANATTRGTGDANVIAAYTYLGGSTLVRKTLPQPAVRLDYWGGTSGSYAGFDRFGRITNQRWDRYDGNDDHVSDVIHIAHGYDRAGNRLYAQRQVYTSHSEVYGYDGLHRLTSFKSGLINSAKDDVQAYWQPGRGEQSWTLDPLGNQLALSDQGTASYFQNTPNKANEYTSRKVQAAAAKPAFASDAFASDTSSHWSKPGSGDAFNVNSGVAGRLVVTTVSQDTISSVQEPTPAAILLLGESMGPLQATVTLRFPSGTTAGQAGLVFGYQSGANYWLRVLDLDAQEVRVYHVLNGAKTLHDAQAYTLAADTDLSVEASSKRQSLWMPSVLGFAAGEGYPAGQVGLFTTVANTQFDDYQLYDDAQYRALGDRWMSFSAAAALNATDDRLELSASPASPGSPVLLRSVRTGGFEAVFAVRRVGAGSDHRLAFVFHAQDQDAFNYVTLDHTDTQAAPRGYRVVDGQLASEVAGTRVDANMPSLTAGDVLWVRVRCDGTNLAVRCAASAAGLSSASDAYATSNFPSVASGGGGMMGWMAAARTLSVDDLTLKRWNPGTSSYDVTEHEETFTADANGNVAETLAHDAAGNLTYDGVYAYGYDAWNRLVTVRPAWRDAPPGGGDLQFGSIIQSNAFDGAGRRIVQTLTHLGDLTATSHVYYDAGGHSPLEERDGDDQTLRQLVWGRMYIDELVQIGLNDDPADSGEAAVESFHYALPNANFNVLAVVDDAGAVVERYEYTAYGERTVYAPAGDHDPAGESPRLLSRRVTVGGVAQAYGLNPVGHQGLWHEDATGLVYNRARHLHPRLGRFGQRDPMGYVDGANLYPSYHLMRFSLDPYGLSDISPDHGTDITGKKLFKECVDQNLFNNCKKQAKSDYERRMDDLDEGTRMLEAAADAQLQANLRRCRDGYQSRVARRTCEYGAYYVRGNQRTLITLAYIEASGVIASQYAATIMACLEAATFQIPPCEICPKGSKPKTRFDK